MARQQGLIQLTACRVVRPRTVVFSMKRWLRLNGPLVLLALAVLIGFVCYSIASGMETKTALSVIGFVVTALITGMSLRYFVEKRRDLLLTEN